MQLDCQPHVTTLGGMTGLGTVTLHLWVFDMEGVMSVLRPLLQA